MIGAEGLDEFDVLGLCARLDENAQVGLAFVKGLCTLAEATSKTIVLQGVLDHLLYDETSWSSATRGRTSRKTMRDERRSIA